jgi:hypothetical protein
MRLSEVVVTIGELVTSGVLVTIIGESAGVLLLMSMLEASLSAMIVTGGGALGAVSAADSVVIDISSDFWIWIGWGFIAARGSITGRLPAHPDAGGLLPDDQPLVSAGGLAVGFLRRSSKSHIHYRVIKVLRLS